MKNNKRRLLKDLPFASLGIGTVLYRVNNSYQVSSGKTYYKGGGSSDNGVCVLDTIERDIVNEIWDNEDWFEDADLNHITFEKVSNGILLKFDPIDIDEKEDFIKGLIHILPLMCKKGYTWSKFANITTEIK